MQQKIINEEVYYANEPVVKIDRSDIAQLKIQASGNVRKRARLCAHPSPEDKLHEMFIIHSQDAYVMPHKHPGKSESFHIIEGQADIILFDDHGKVQEVVPMGEYGSGKKFYYRLNQPVFHTLLIFSEVLVFHEVTNGPFDKKDTVFAPWAPREGEEQKIKDFQRSIRGVKSREGDL